MGRDAALEAPPACCIGHAVFLAQAGPQQQAPGEWCGGVRRWQPEPTCNVQIVGLLSQSSPLLARLKSCKAPCNAHAHAQQCPLPAGSSCKLLQSTHVSARKTTMPSAQLLWGAFANWCPQQACNGQRSHGPLPAPSRQCVSACLCWQAPAFSSPLHIPRQGLLLELHCSSRQVGHARGPACCVVNLFAALQLKNEETTVH